MKKINISVAVVFYRPTEENIKRSFENFQNLNKLNNDFNFKFFAIDNSPELYFYKEIKNKAKTLKNVCVKHLMINKGFGAAHNSIINNLKSDFHIVMNPDIEISDLKGFKKAIIYMKQNNKVVLLSPMVKNADGTIQYLNRRKHTVLDLTLRFLGTNFLRQRQDYFVKKSTGYSSIQVDENATGCFMILRTEVFKKLSGFDTRFFMYFEDADLSYRCEKEGKVIFYPYFTVRHMWKRDNHNLNGLINELKSMVLFFNKWGWKFL